MAFFSKAGNILKQTVTRHINSEVCGSTPSIFQVMRSMSSSKLFVGGISYATDDMSLREAFDKYGEVIEARVIIDRDTGRSRGFGFVTYTSSEQASAAIQALDGQDLHGRRVRVNYANDRPRSGGFGGGGYGGGGFGGAGAGADGGFGGGGYGNVGNYGGGDNYGNAGGYGGGSYGSGGMGNNSYGGGNFSQGGTSPTATGYDSVNSGSQSSGVAGGVGGSFASAGYEGDQLDSNDNEAEDAPDNFGEDGNYRDEDDENDDVANRKA
ncbi:glycine-rich RNA-binding protein 3, mitochondrial [Diospyros lotus]|uniref:glycine-rich RNA-binding protein 3, mitochondrial n=1 Tax=Diospyros lotus TaxID=55363 RepID=UPI00225B7004|nr:glycine-rich RNA-binding protein 3, mitochondrial [Diospyros lotus]